MGNRPRLVIYQQINTSRGPTGILCVLCHAILCVNMLLTVQVIVSDGFPKKFVLGGGVGGSFVINLC